MLPRELVEGTRSISRLGLWPGVLLLALAVLLLMPAVRPSQDWGFEVLPVRLR